MKQMIKHISFLSVLLGVIVLSGCLVTGTFVIDFRISDSDINDDNEEFIFFAVDLTEEDDWNDHKDKIKNIDNVGFQLWLTNNSTEAMSAKFYIAPHTATPAYADSNDVKANADLILTGLSVSAGPGTEKHIDWPTSLSMIKNLDIIKNYAESGEFSIYIIKTPATIDFTLDSANVIVTFTAGY